MYPEIFPEPSYRKNNNQSTQKTLQMFIAVIYVTKLTVNAAG